MKILIVYVVCLFCFYSSAQIYNQKTWATYYFGAASNAIDLAVDNEGNILVLGNTRKWQDAAYYSNFTTFGAHKSGFNPAIISSESDCILSKFSPSGTLIWATQFGGDKDDNVYTNQLVLDTNNNIYFVGMTSSITGIATAGSFDESPPLGNGAKIFLTKFDTNGVQQWGTYINGIGLFAGICIDTNNNIFVNGYTSIATGISTIGAYQYNYENYIITESQNSGVSNGFVLKFDSNGNRLAGTYLGKTSPNFILSSMCLDNNGNVIVTQQTTYYSNNQFATPGCFQNMNSTAATFNIPETTITKLNSSLSQVIWSTYFSNANIFSITCNNNTIFIAGVAQQANNFTTPGSFQPNILNNTTYGNGFLACFNADGARQWATYYPQRIDRVAAFNNKLYVNGATYDANNNLGTVASYQNTFYGGTSDGFFSEFNLDGTRNWSSYFGGEKTEIINSICINNNNMYVVGTTKSYTNISTTGSFQSSLNHGALSQNDMDSVNMFLAKFNKDNLNTNDYSKLQSQLSPNPNNGQFTITGNINNLQKNMSLLIYDGLGRQITSKEIQVTGNQINQIFNFANQLSQGIYFAKISDGISVLQTFKVLVK